MKGSLHLVNVQRFWPPRTTSAFENHFYNRLLWERLALWIFQIFVSIYVIWAVSLSRVKSLFCNLWFQTFTIHCHHSMYGKWKCYKNERGKLFNGLKKRKKNVFSFKCLPSLFSRRGRNNVMIGFFLASSEGEQLWWSKLPKLEFRIFKFRAVIP